MRKKKGWMSFSAYKGTTKVPMRQKASREEQPKGLPGQSRDAKGHTVTGTPWCISNGGGNQKSNLLDQITGG